MLGISGDYINANVSHDEIDAVTCALVGLFFLNGKYKQISTDYGTDNQSRFAEKR